MKITPIYRSIKFTSQTNHPHPNPPESPWHDLMSEDDLENSSKTMNSVLGFMAGLSLGIFATAVANNGHNGQFAQKTIHTIESNDIKKDSIIITDITGDENPDIVLLKEDGSKVVIDLFKQQIMENDSVDNK